MLHTQLQRTFNGITLQSNTSFFNVSSVMLGGANLHYHLITKHNENTYETFPHFYPDKALVYPCSLSVEMHRIVMLRAIINIMVANVQISLETSWGASPARSIKNDQELLDALNSE